MTTRELFLKTIKAEQPIFERVLKAIPEEKWDYQPDPVTRSAKQIASQLANEASQLSRMAHGEILDFSKEIPNNDYSLSDVVSKSNEGFKELEKTVSGMSDDEFETTDAGMVGWKDKFVTVAFGFLMDMIHHRGQISAYLRAMGGKVPSIYGPSGDHKE